MKITTVSALVTALVLGSPLHAEETSPDKGQQDETVSADQPGPIERRIRAHRESYDRKRKSAPEYDRALSPRQQKIHEQMDARRQAWLEQVEERRALNEQRRETRRQQREARLEAWLKETEDRLERDVSRHETLRNQAEDRYNYLVENQDELLKHRLKQQEDFANRQEELRRKAEQRRKKLITLRERIRGMPAAERRAELEKFRNELYGERPVSRQRTRPAYARPPAPPAGSPAAE